MPTIKVQELELTQRKIVDDRLVIYIAGGLIGIFLIFFMLVPVSNILRLSITPYNPETHIFDQGLTLNNFITYFSTPTIVQSLYNSLNVSLWVTLITTILAFFFAYGLTRTTIYGKKILYFLAMAPLVAPSLLQAMALVSLFGRNGLITGFLNTEWNIYGATGIIISEVLYSFPHAMIILYTTLSAVDSRLDEAASSLGASDVKIFFKITVPTARYGIISAAALVFNLAITDFGNPIIIGQNYKVLATEIYLQVIGMQRFDMGATIAVVLLVPSVIAFLLNYYFTKRNSALISGHAKPTLTPSGPFKRRIFTSYCWIITGILLSVILVIICKAFITLWMYNWTPTLKHFNFRIPGGMGVLWTSLWISIIVAISASFLTMVNGYIIEKKNPFFAQPLYLLSVIPAAIPGLVMGLSYILIFNTRFLHIGDLLYGKAALVIISVVICNFTLGTLSSITNMKNIDKEMDESATSLGATIITSFTKVVFPLNKVSFFGNLNYYFMRSMVTISAVIFLVSPDVHLAAISVVNLEKDGKDGASSAMSFLIILVVMISVFLLNLFNKKNTKTETNQSEV